MIWGAGRLTTNLNGRIIVSGSKRMTIGNVSINNTTTEKGTTVIEVTERYLSNVTFLNALITSNKNAIGIRLRGPGSFLIQGCSFTNNDIGLSLEDNRASANVFGGNMQSNRIHIQQVKGHLDARAFGVQMNQGDADIAIQSPSPLGYHLIEGVRSEGSNGTNAEEVLVKVPQTPKAVNVVLRANSLGSMARYADYGANGTLLLLENVNYLGEDDKSSVGVTVTSKGAAKLLSIGNRYGLSYDLAPGPFVISPTTTVQSVGDLWMLPNQNDYSKSFNEPITKERMKAAGKPVPRGLSFLTTADSNKVQIPEFPLYKVAVCPRIANLNELMLNVKDFGAIPDDGKDDQEAIQRALDAAEKVAYEPIYFPSGKYELNAPLFLDHLAGGGFWGDGADKSILVSTSGNGVLTSDGAGYSTFVDIGFENKPLAQTKTTDFDWINNQSPDKKRGNTGAALQANMFYRCRFENGNIGMAVGRNRMGDSFMIIDCVFRNHTSLKGEGAAYASEGFNSLTNPLIHCLFNNVDYAVLNTKGSFNFYGNRLTNIHNAALKLFTIVGDGFCIINNEMDESPVPLVSTGHSSAKAHLLIERTRVNPSATTTIGSSYELGGSILFLHSSFPNRTISNSGSIGDNSLILYRTVAADGTISGRAHGYFLQLKRITK